MTNISDEKRRRKKHTKRGVNLSGFYGLLEKEIKGGTAYV